MNARTSRLLRRMAHAVAQVERRVAELYPDEAPKNIATYAMQLRQSKDAWMRTQRPARGAARVRLVGLFGVIVKGPQ